MRYGFGAAVVLVVVALAGITLFGYGLYAVGALLPYWPCPAIATSVPAGYCVSHAEMAFASGLVVGGATLFFGSIIARRRLAHR